MNRLTFLLAALCMSVMSLVAQQTAQVRQLLDSAQYAEAAQLCTIELQQHPKNGMLYRYRAVANIMQEGVAGYRYATQIRQDLGSVC